MEKNLIEGDVAFPIYKFEFRWSQDGVQESEYPKWYEGLPKGKIWNATGFSKMFKEEVSQEWLDSYAKDWWEKFLKQKTETIVNPELTKIEAKFFEYETWHLTRFQHETFDTGQTDEEVLKSFEKFVFRKQILNEQQQRIDGKDKYCLMGAEDRWRWCGSGDDGDSEKRTDPPCRCVHCKKQSLIRIGH